MSDKLMTDVGENFEYIRTIIDNKIEIAKIDLSVGTAKAIGYIILGLFLLGMLGLFIMSLIILLAVYLAQVTDSLITGIALSSLCIIIISVIMFLLRKPMIFTPFAYLFYNLIADEE